MTFRQVTAHLPMADIEICHRELPDGRAELVSIRMTALPLFEAMVRWVTQASVLAFAPWTLMLSGWQPWLPVDSEPPPSGAGWRPE